MPDLRLMDPAVVGALEDEIERLRAALEAVQETYDAARHQPLNPQDRRVMQMVRAALETPTPPKVSE